MHEPLLVFLPPFPLRTKVANKNCDWILENGYKSHIFISVYLSLQHEKYCIPNNIS